MEQTPGKAFYQRQIAALEAHDMDALMMQYHLDATMVGFDFTVKGHEAIRKHMEGYLEGLGTLKLQSTEKFTETDDAIFFEATITTKLGEARVYDVFLLRDGKATHHFSGLISLVTGSNARAMVLHDAVRQALTGGHLAHLVTLNADGSPQVSLVWVGLDGDEVVCAHLGSRKKVTNIQQDARVTLSMETGGKSGILDNYLVLSGRARVTEGGAPELLHRLAQVYIGPETNFPGDNLPAGYITHIQVEHISGVGPW